MTQEFGHAPSAEDIEAIARDRLCTLPKQFQAKAATVVVQVAELARPEILADLGITDPFELTGLYDGIPLTEKSTFDQPLQPDAIWLFRRPILDEWADRGNVSLRELVGHVLIHELAHHFGWSDDDIAAIDRWWE